MLLIATSPMRLSSNRSRVRTKEMRVRFILSYGVTSENQWKCVYDLAQYMTSRVKTNENAYHMTSRVRTNENACRIQLIIRRLFLERPTSKVWLKFKPFWVVVNDFERTIEISYMRPPATTAPWFNLSRAYPEEKQYFMIYLLRLGHDWMFGW